MRKSRNSFGNKEASGIREAQRKKEREANAARRKMLKIQRRMQRFMK